MKTIKLFFALIYAFLSILCVIFIYKSCQNAVFDDISVFAFLTKHTKLAIVLAVSFLLNLKSILSNIGTISSISTPIKLLSIFLLILSSACMVYTIYTFKIIFYN